MTDKDKIKQYVERQKSQAHTIASLGINSLSGYQLACDNIIDFINSLPEEPASEDLEEEITKCYKRRIDLMMTRSQFGELIHRFTEWQKQKDFEELLKSDMTQFKECYEKGQFDMREKMMKTLVGGEIVKDIHNQLSVKSEPLNDAFRDIKFGEKVKIIICKSEQQ